MVVANGGTGSPAPAQLQAALTQWFDARLKRRLAWALAASFALPWLAGEFAKQFVQPGLHNDAQRGQLLIDFIVIGTIVFALTLVLTWLIGSWVTAVMKGPQIEGDAFPADAAGGFAAGGPASDPRDEA